MVLDPHKWLVITISSFRSDNHADDNNIWDVDKYFWIRRSNDNNIPIFLRSDNHAGDNDFCNNRRGYVARYRLHPTDR